MKHVSSIVNEERKNRLSRIHFIFPLKNSSDLLQVRVATEGINGTVGGTKVATDIYIKAMCSHPLFKMDEEDFKVRAG